MPRQRYATVQSDLASLDSLIRIKLETGCSYFFPGEEPPEVELRRLWDAHREQLLAAWIFEQPCTRPWAWWKWDAPKETRRRIGGVGTALKERPDGGDPFSFGAPNCFEGDYSHKDGPRYESERDYLRRHRLLQEGE